MKTLKEEREAIVEEFIDSATIELRNYTWVKKTAKHLRTALLSHEEKVVERVREILLRKASLVENPIETSEGTIDGSFYQIYRGELETALTLPITDENV